MEVSSQLHVPVASTPVKELLLHKRRLGEP
jgi:hypothetical protein